MRKNFKLRRPSKHSKAFRTLEDLQTQFGNFRKHGCFVGTLQELCRIIAEIYMDSEDNDRSSDSQMAIGCRGTR